MVCCYSMYKQKQHVSHLFTIKINLKKKVLLDHLLSSPGALTQFQHVGMYSPLEILLPLRSPMITVTLVWRKAWGLLSYHSNSFTSLANAGSKNYKFLQNIALDEMMHF